MFNVYINRVYSSSVVMNVADSPNLYRGMVNVRDNEKLVGRFCVILDGNQKEENVNDSCSYFGSQDKSQYRKWDCNSTKLTLVAVVYDIFEYSLWQPNSLNRVSPHIDFSWSSLFAYFGSYFIHSDIHNYYSNLCSLNFASYDKNIRIHPYLLLNRLMKCRQTDMKKGEVFIKWVILLDFIKTQTLISSTLRSDILIELKHIDAIEIREIIESRSLNENIIASICELVSQIVALNLSECVPWALLRLTFSKFKPSEILLRQHGAAMAPYLNSFLPYISADCLPLGLLPNLRSLFDLLENKDDKVKPEVIKRIIESDYYIPSLQRSDSQKGLEELKLMYLLISKDSSLWSVFLFHPLFQVNSFAVADLRLVDFIQITLIEFLQLGPSRKDFISRCYAVSKVLELRTQEENFVADIYQSLHQLMAITSTPEIKIVINTLHSSLPTVEGKALRTRVELYLEESEERLVDMEQKAFDTIFGNPTSDILKIRSIFFWDNLGRKKNLLAQSNPNWKRLAYMLGLLWEKSLESLLHFNMLSQCEIESLSILFNEADQSKHYTFHLLFSEQVRDLHDQLKLEMEEFPHLVEEERYDRCCQKYSLTCKNIDALAANLKDRSLTIDLLNLILRHDWIMKNLPVLSKFKVTKEMIIDTQSYIDKIREEWTSLLSTFRDFMSIHPRFETCSHVFVDDVQDQISSLNSQFINVWTRPTFGGDMEERSKNLAIAQESYVYQWCFSRQLEEEQNITVSTDLNSALDQWKSSIDRSLSSWTLILTQISDGSYPSAYLKSIFHQLIEGTPTRAELPNHELRARDIINRHLTQVQNYLESIVNQEVKASGNIMRALKKNFEPPDFKTNLLKFLQAVSFSETAKSLFELFQLLNQSWESFDPLIELIRKVSEFSNENTLSDVATLYVRSQTLYPEAFQIVSELPGDLITLIKEDFLGLLNDIVDVRSLNQTVDRLQNQVEPALLNELYVLRNVYNALAFDVESFAAFRLKQSRNLKSTCSYLASIGWCLCELKSLIGAVRKLSDLYAGGVSRTSAVALVHALLSNGVFSISLPDAFLSAVITLNGEERTLNPVELGDIPFQLCLHGAVTTIDDSVDTSNQRHFLRTMELLTQLREGLSKLSIAGHPNFHDSILKIPGSISCADLEELVAKYQIIDLQWHTFLSEYADVNLPLLTCISRKQLVESLKVLTQMNSEVIGSFVTILRTVYPLMSLEDARRHVSDDLQQVGSRGAKQVFEQIHSLLKKGVTYLFPNRINRSDKLVSFCQIFNALIPSKLSPPSGVLLLKLRQEDIFRHCELCCALFIHLYFRLPTSLEVFHCTSDTSEQSIGDFLRRWAASQHFKSYFPEEERSFLFCMLNVELLKPNLQNTVLTKINFFRTTVQTPILLFASSYPQQESLLCLGLRKDWVNFESHERLYASCKTLLVEYFKYEFHSVHLMKSKYPQSGKSTSIVENFVVCENNTLYSRIPLTEDLDDVSRLLISVTKQREAINHSGTNFVLHFNIGSRFDVQQLNRFIMSYIVTGVYIDSNGAICIRNANDIIVLEWPSEGILGEKALDDSGLCSSFQPHSPKNGVSLSSHQFLPCFARNDCILFRVVKEANLDLEIGVKLALAFFRINPSDSNNLLLPFPDDVVRNSLPDSVLLYDIFSKKVSDALGYSSISPGLVYRFIKFFAHQLFGLYYFPYYQSSPFDDENSQNYRRLAYYLALTSFQLATKLAASAVHPLTENAIDDDDDRLSHLIFSFEDWSKNPFLVFNVNKDTSYYTSDYTMVSVTSENFLSVITATDTNRNFREFIRRNVRNSSEHILRNVCAGLNDENYHPSSDPRPDHPLRVLLPIVNAKPNFGLLIFTALDMLRCNSIAPNAPITLLYENHRTALEQLRSITGLSRLDDSKTVSDFKREAQLWFESITGSYSSDSAPFVLTVDNLIRILAMKLRLACHIPVVFMGETGCGKVRFLMSLAYFFLDTCCAIL